jgi:hypothetical protein
MARQTLWTAALAVALAVGTAVPSQAQGQGRGFRGRGGFGGPGFLLRMPEVQKELKLEAAQVELLNALQHNRPQFNREEFQNLSQDERRKRFEAMRAEQEKKVAEILNKDQVARLKQLELQQEGVRALGRTEVANALKLSADQKSKIDKINEEERAAMQQAFQGFRNNNGQQPSQEDRRAAFEKIQAMRTANEAKILGVLTDGQKKQFEAMQGPKFTFPERRRGRGNNGNA